MQMAPQNSTLLHENAELLADEIIRYSPILSQPNEHDCDSGNTADDYTGYDDGMRRKKSIPYIGAVDTQVRAIYYTDIGDDERRNEQRKKKKMP